MPQPGRATVHVNRPLTNISIAFLQNAANFVADRVFPTITVSKRSDRYFVYERGDFNRDEMEERAPATESAGGDYNIDNTPTYFARYYSFHRDIDDQTRENYDEPLDADREATEYVSHKALIRKERLFVTKYFVAGVWTTDITGVAGAPAAGQAQQWDQDASTPIEDVATGKDVVLESTGFEPNVCVLGQQVWTALKNHPDIVGRIDRGQTPGGPAMTLRENLAALFEVDEVLIMKSIVNTAAEGQTAVHSFIGGKNALLAYRTPSPGIMVPSAGYTFQWGGLSGSGPGGTRIKRFRIEKIESDRVEIGTAFDQKLVAADLGYFFLGIVA